MKNIFKIYKRDIKTMCTNWAARIMIIIIILIPSLYSLINIEASWDPYANTDGIKIAVINKDKGTVFKNEDINLGEELIEKLEDNDKMGWEFVDEETGKNGLLLEKYYATIEIPENFSENVTTLVGKDVVNPKLIYTVNEKKNSIAPKLTDAGVNSVKSQLDENIVKTVSGILFRICDETGVEIEGKRPDIRKIIDEIYELDEQMPELENILNNAIDGTIEVKEVLNKTNDIIPTISNTLDSTDDFLNNSQEFLDRAQSDLSDISPLIKDDLVLSEKLLDNTSTNLDNLDENILPEVAKKTLISVSESAKATQSTVVATKDKLKSIKNFLKKLTNYNIPELDINDENGDLQSIKDEYEKQIKALESMKHSFKDINKTIDNLIDKLDKVDEKLDIVITRVDDEIEELDNGKKLDTQTLTDVREVVSEIHTLVSDVVDSYDSEIVSGIEYGFNCIRSIFDNSLSILKEGRDTLPQLEEILSSAMGATDLSNEELLALKNKFPDAKDKVHEIADKLREMDEDEQFNEIIDLITNDWSEQSDFLASAVEIEDNRLFPFPNYGSASAPFYTVLCLWVGALIGSALLSLEVPELEEGIKLKPYEIYLGKLLTFLTLAIFEAIVASLGAILLLKTYAVHPVMFVLYAIFVSLVFTVIVYTAASLLDDVGKAIIVVILVLQLAGTGGTFPIEVTPQIFQQIYKYLPFTYATNGMRQIMGGIVYPILIKDIIYLSIYMIGALIVGLSLKGVMNKVTEIFVEKLYSSGILRH